MNMTTWKPEPDPENHGHWRIVNVTTGKTVVYGLTKTDAENFVERRNYQERKRHERAKATTGHSGRNA